MDLAAGFVLVFGVIGVLECIDRTNFALISFAARRSLRESWAGAAAAFVVTTAISVGIGEAFARLLGAQLHYVQLGGGILLLAYAGYLALVPESARAPPTSRSTIASAFLLIFLLELGDTTMILLILLTGTVGNPFVVFAAGALALACVAALGCVIGHRLGAMAEPRAVERAVVVVLAIIGTLTVATALDPALIPTVLR